MKPSDVSDLDDMKKRVTDFLKGKPRDPKRILGSFRRQQKALLAALDDNQSDALSFQIAALRALLRSAMDLVALSEEAAHRSGGRAVYSAVAAADLIRGILDDIGKLESRERAMSQILANIIEPAMVEMARVLSAELARVQSELPKNLPPIASKTLQRQFDHLRDRTAVATKEARERIKSELDRLTAVKRSNRA